MTEHGTLESVLLYVPGKELAGIGDPAAALHDGPIDPAALPLELRTLAGTFRKLGVKVSLIPRDAAAPPNLMYVRDLFFCAPRAAVIARMSSPARAPEPAYAARALRRLGMPVTSAILGEGRFEGSDALWLDPRTVVCGVGGRTNEEGYRQLRAALGRQGAQTIRVRAPRGVLHLLGALQLVDAGLALVRKRAAGKDLLSLLKRRGIRVVAVPETAETTTLHGMNVVTVAPRTVIMPRGCPGLERLYRAAGLRIAAKVDARQLVRGAGGLACATGIVSRGR